MTFVITDDHAHLAQWLHEAEPGSWMMTPTAIDKWRLIATTETALTKALDLTEPLEPHKGKGWVRIVLLQRENFTERWREIRMNAN